MENENLLKLKNAALKDIEEAIAMQDSGRASGKIVVVME